MFGRLFKSKDPIGDFWAWFLANDEQLFRLGPENQKLWNELGKRLQKIHESMTFEMSVTEVPPKEFIVSGDGIRAAFPMVRETVKRAPAMPRWQIIAFRQPSKEGMTVEMNGIRFSADNIFYRSRPNGAKLSVDLFLDGLNKNNYEQMISIGFIMLDASIGEYDVETKLDIDNFLPIHEGLDGMKPLTSLSEELHSVPGVPA